MRHFSLLACTLIVLFIPSPAFAQNCDNGGTNQVEMTYCAGLDLKEADNELNRIWKTISKNFGQGGWDRRRKKALLTSQRAWIAYRDADCQEAVGIEWEGGTGRSGAELSCAVELTTERVKTLKNRYLNH